MYVDDQTTLESSLGKGFAHPVKVGRNGSLGTVEGEDHLSGCLTRLALYRKGDTAGVWSLGGNVFAAVFAVNALSLKTQLEEDITQTVRDFEGRVSNVKVLISRGDEDHAIEITAIYTVADTKELKKTNIPV